MITPFQAPKELLSIAGISLILALVLMTLPVSAADDTTRPNLVFNGSTAPTLSGTVTFTSHASDLSGIEQMGINFHDPKTHAFKKNCGSVRALGAAPSHVFTCTFDTTKLPNGQYEVRAGAHDAAGNVRTSSEWVTILNEVE